MHLGYTEMKLLRVLNNCSGAVAVITAITLPLLLGMTSLGIEVGHWYLVERVMQGAADAAAISAGSEYVKQYNSGNPTSTSYQLVGQHYAGVNGYSIPISYVCLIDPSGSDGCGVIEAIDQYRGRVICNSPPCIAVEITQTTSTWASTEGSLEPSPTNFLQRIPQPTLLARSVVSVKSQLNSTTASDCVLALANAPDAILVHGGGDPQAKCGISIDGGRDQNAGTPIVGGLTFNGNGSKINVNALKIAATTASCPDDGTHCQQYGSTQPLLASQVALGVSTIDPYAPTVAAIFSKPPPTGANGITLKSTGTGYTHSATCTFTVAGTYYGTTASPVIFTATTDRTGKVNGIVSILDPGAYATPGFPTGTVSATSTNCGGGSGTTVTLTQGCWTFNGSVTAIPGRKYCSINLKGAAGTINFPAGTYWIAGGDNGCSGFCVSSVNTTVTSAPAGVTFLLTNGEGANSGNYATVAISSGNIQLCAPGTGCGTSCTVTANNPTSCMLFAQNSGANTPTSTSNAGPPNTVNSFTGNGTETLAGLIYLPKQTFTIGGGASTTGCVAAVAKYFDIGGTPTFSDGCLPGNGIGTTTVTTTLSQPHLSQ